MEDKLKQLDIRGLVLSNIAETRSVRNLLTNHLHSHEIADSRRWKIYLMLFGSFLATVGGCTVALFTFLL